MNLQSLTNDSLLDRTEHLCKSERKITHLILWHINEIESRGLFAEKGYSSMFKFLTKHLGYGEGAAWERLHASRLLKKIPVLQEKIETGTLNLTQIANVQKCLNKEARSGNVLSIGEAVQVLSQIEELNGFETQKVLAVEFNLPIQQHEVLKPQRDESVRLELTLTEDQMNRLRQVKHMMSHNLHDATWADVIDALAAKHIEKIQGKEKLVIEKLLVIEDGSVESNDPLGVTPCFSATEKSKRKSIKITSRRELLSKAGQCCEFTDPKSGIKCNGTYQLQIDHKIPLALGGSNELSNLRVLCRTHNLFAAKQVGLSQNYKKDVISARV